MKQLDVESKQRFYAGMRARATTEPAHIKGKGLRQDQQRRTQMRSLTDADVRMALLEVPRAERADDEAGNSELAVLSLERVRTSCDCVC